MRPDGDLGSGNGFERAQGDDDNDAKDEGLKLLARLGRADQNNDAL